jgi:hypothetical protein
MFERLRALAERRAEERAHARRAALAARLQLALPRDIAAAETEAGALLSGRGLRRRLALDARLGWLIAGLIR